MKKKSESFLKDFKNFIKRGSAIDLAIGIIVGTTMTSVVNSLVKDIIMPPIGMLIGGVDFSQIFIILKGGAAGVHYNTIAAAQEAGAITLNIGMFINSLISFLITMFAIFMVLKITNRIRGNAPATTRTCPFCQTSTVSIAAVKCPACCSELSPTKTDDLPKTNILDDVKKSKIVKEIKKIKNKVDNLI